MSETREEVGSDGRPTSRPRQAEQTSLIINIYVFCLFVYDFMFVCLLRSDQTDVAVSGSSRF